MVRNCCFGPTAATRTTPCRRSRSSSRASSANPDVDRALTGIPASPGIVVGPVHLLRWEVPDVPTHIIPDDAIPPELERYRAAVDRAKERLAGVRGRAAAHAGPEEAAIFDVQISMLEDRDLANQVESYIRQNLAAEKAFDVVLHEWRARFAHHASPMMRERVGDLTDVHIRVLSILLGLPDHDPVDVPKGARAILVTHDLTPSLTVQLDRDAIAGIATDAGTRTAHVAILARSLGLPAVVGLRDAISRLTGREHAVLDGSTGTLVVNPTDAEVAVFHHRAEREARDEAELRLLATAEPVTTDGERIVLRANVDL